MAESPQSNKTPTTPQANGNLFLASKIKGRIPETPKPTVENPTPVHPLFVLNKTLLPPNYTGYVSQFELLLACEMEVGEDQIDAIIRSGALWRIYPRNEDAKQTLLMYGITFMGFQVQLLESNPFNTDTTKLFVSGLPLCVTNQEMLQYLKEIGIKPLGDVEFELIVDSKNVITTCKSGRRICKIEKPSTNLDKTLTIGTFKCPIFYYGQVRNNKNQENNERSNKQNVPQPNDAVPTAEEHPKNIPNNTDRVEDILSSFQNLPIQDKIPNKALDNKVKVNDKVNSELLGNDTNSLRVNTVETTKKIVSSPPITPPSSKKNQVSNQKEVGKVPSNKENYSAIAKGLFTKRDTGSSPQTRGRTLHRQVSLSEHLGKRLPIDGRKKQSPNRKRSSSVSKNPSLVLSPAKRLNYNKDNTLKEMMHKKSVVQFASTPSRDGHHELEGV